MAKHALLSPSSSKRWMTCPGSVPLSEGLPDTSSAYADEGTAAHFLASECLLTARDASSYLDAVIELRKYQDVHHEAWSSSPRIEGDEVLNTFTVDGDMAEAVQVYLDYVRDLSISTNGALFVEVQVPLDHMTGEEEATGTSDAIILANDEVIVVDLKFGRGVEVSAEGNSQMLMYASGALRYIEDLVGGTEKVKRIRAVISQPRVSHAPSEWDCDIQYLRDFEKEVKEAAVVVEMARQGYVPARLCASDEACRFCKAKARCPEVIRIVEENLGEGFTDLDAVPAVTNDADNVLLGKHLDIVDFIEGWCKAVRAEGESQLLRGIPVPGYKLVQGRKGSRNWEDEEKAAAALKKCKLKKDEMYVSKLITPAVAEKLIGNKDPRWPKLTPLIVQKEGGISIAPESDKREAIVVKDPTDDFSPL